MGGSPNTVSAQVQSQSREITPVTRRDIFDFLRAEAGPWWGRLSEIDFLEQLYDLDVLPSTDPRHATAAEDIIRHRIANFDWDHDWVFDDPRFRLIDGPDQVLLDFLAQMAHPLVQPDTDGSNPATCCPWPPGELRVRPAPARETRRTGTAR